MQGSEQSRRSARSPHGPGNRYLAFAAGKHPLRVWYRGGKPALDTCHEFCPFFRLGNALALRKPTLKSTTVLLDSAVGWLKSGGGPTGTAQTCTPRGTFERAVDRTGAEDSQKKYVTPEKWAFACRARCLSQLKGENSMTTQGSGLAAFIRPSALMTLGEMRRAGLRYWLFWHTSAAQMLSRQLEMLTAGTADTLLAQPKQGSHGTTAA